MRRILFALLGALISGPLLALSMPPHRFPALGWLALVPLALCVRRSGFAVGFLAGLAACLTAAWFDAQGFLLGPPIPEGDSGWTYVGFTIFGLVVGTAMSLRGASEKLRNRPLALAGWATLFEAASLVYLPVHLALSQSRSTFALEVARWLAIWGVSFFIWLATFWIALQLENRRFGRALFWVFLLPLLSIGVPRPFKGDLWVGVIQTRATDEPTLARLNREAGQRGAEVVVWPELSATALAGGGNTSDLRRLAQSEEQPPFVTSFPDGATPKPHNAAALFSPSGESERYFKRRPFAGEKNMHAAGTEAVSAELNGLTHGLNICFDTCFPWIMRDTAHLPGIDAVLLPTLDPVDTYGVIQAIHAAYTPFRAAEYGLPIIRADITSGSMIVAPDGRIIAALDSQPDTVLVANVPVGKRWTLVTFWGDWFLAVCGLLALWGLRPVRKGKLPAN